MNNKALFIVMGLVISPFLVCFTAPVEAADTDLARQYAPILYFEKEEICYPVDVSYHIENSYLYQITETDPEIVSVLVSDSPSIEDLGGDATEDYFLDNQRGTIDDNGIINDYKIRLGSLGYTVYSHVISNGGTTVVQYWMFYAFNKGSLNIHEGDWEMVQVVLSNEKPTEVMYSQHHSGQKATWDQVEREGDHIKVYVARGSHANYLRSYSGVIGAASDTLGANGKVLSVNEYSLDSLDPQEHGWLNFEGRWGEFRSINDVALERVGPQGPMYREEGAIWSSPVSWGNGLPQANDTVFLLEWFLYNFISLFLISIAISLLVSIFLIYRRHKRYGLGPRVVSMLYIDGFNIKSIGNIVCFIGIFVAVFGLFNPWYSVAGELNVEGFETPDMMDIILIDGVNGLQITIPGTSGPVPLGSVTMPFSLIIGIGLVFLIIRTVGISTSKKLGKKYIYRGFRLAFVIIMILIAIMSLGVLGNMIELEQSADTTVSEVFSALSSKPFGGSETISLDVPDIDSTSFTLKWGLGLGGELLLIAGFIIVIAGVMQFAANTEFFERRQFGKIKKVKSKKPKKEKLKRQAEESKEETREIKPLESKKPEKDEKSDILEYVK